MDQNVVFKSAAVGGFEKRAVLDYIYKMNEDMEKERNEYLSKIDELKHSSMSVEEQTDKINKSMLALEKDLERLSTEITQEKKRATDLQEENNQLRAEVVRLKADKPPAVVAPPQPSVNEERLRELELKREEIEKASYQVGRVMLDARADADNIVDGAREQSRKIVEEAENTVRTLKSDAQAEVDDLIATAKQKAEEEIDKANTESSAIVSEAENLAKARSEASKVETEKTTAELKKRITEIVSASKNLSTDSTVKLESLEKETQGISKSLSDVVNLLLEKTKAIEESVVQAKEKIVSEQESLNQIKVIELAGLSLEELDKIAAVAPIVKEEVVEETVKQREEPTSNNNYDDELDLDFDDYTPIFKSELVADSGEFEEETTKTEELPLLDEIEKKENLAEVQVLDLTDDAKKEKPQVVKEEKEKPETEPFVVVNAGNFPSQQVEEKKTVVEEKREVKETLEEDINTQSYVPYKSIFSPEVDAKEDKKEQPATDNVGAESTLLDLTGQIDKLELEAQTKGKKEDKLTL